MYPVLTKEELLSLEDKVIAVDFDGTLVKSRCELTEDGKRFKILDILGPIEHIVELVKTLQLKNKMVLWTSRKGKYLKEAIKYSSKKLGIRWTAVNRNICKSNKGCRKIFADVYIDDRAINPFELYKSIGTETEYLRYRPVVIQEMINELKDRFVCDAWYSKFLYDMIELFEKERDRKDV